MQLMQGIAGRRGSLLLLVADCGPVDVRISQHARLQALERGVSEEEIRRVIARGDRFAGHSGRIGAALVMAYNGVWGRRARVYPQKRVVVFFVEEADTATVITVISQYGQWESSSDVDPLQP
jgi:hypothetical protein